MDSKPTLRKETADLGTAPLGPLLLKLSLPGIAGMFLIAFYSIIDVFWVARLGKEAVAALTVVFPLQMIAGALGIGTGVGVASLVSRRYGAGDFEEVNDVAGHAVTVPLVTGTVLTVLSFLLPDPLLRAFGATPEIMGLARAFLVTVCWGYPFLMFNQTSNGLYRGAGNAVVPMLVMAVSALMNTVLDPLLIFGIGPFPKLGVAGAGIATASSQVFAALCSAVYLRSRHSGYHVRVRNIRLKLRLFVDIFHVGGPAFLMHVGQGLVVGVYNWVLGGYGSAAIGAYGLTFRIMMLIFPVMFGVTQGLMPTVGFNFGARQYGRMWRAVRLAATSTGLLGTVLAAVLWIYARQVVYVFSKDPELERLTVLSLRLVLLTLWTAAPQMMAVSALQGMGMGPQAMLLSLARQLFFLVPGTILLSHFFGVAGAFAAMPVADVLSGTVTGIYVYKVWRRYREPELTLAPSPTP